MNSGLLDNIDDDTFPVEPTAVIEGERDSKEASSYLDAPRINFSHEAGNQPLGLDASHYSSGAPGSPTT